MNIVQQEKRIVNMLQFLKQQEQLLGEIIVRRTDLAKAGHSDSLDELIHNLWLQILHLELLNKENIIEFHELSIK
jgi:hypothetical protein